MNQIFYIREELPWEFMHLTQRHSFYSYYFAVSSVICSQSLRHILSNFVNDSPSLSFLGGYDFALDLYPVNKVGEQTRLYFESKASCEQNVTLLVFPLIVY